MKTLLFTPAFLDSSYSGYYSIEGPDHSTLFTLLTSLDVSSLTAGETREGGEREGGTPNRDDFLRFISIYIKYILYTFIRKK